MRKIYVALRGEPGLSLALQSGLEGKEKQKSRKTKKQEISDAGDQGNFPTEGKKISSLKPQAFLTAASVMGDAYDEV